MAKVSKWVFTLKKGHARNVCDVSHFDTCILSMSSAIFIFWPVQNSATKRNSRHAGGSKSTNQRVASHGSPPKTKKKEKLTYGEARLGSCSYFRLKTELLPFRLGPDYMSRAGPVSRAASVCRDDFLPGIT